MSGDTAISWTDRVWNPVVGCTKVSQGCKHCYAFDVHGIRHKAYQEGKLQNIPQYAHPFTTVQLLPQRLMDPVRWRKSRRIFVNSMSDLFHEDVPEGYIDQVFGVMFVCAEREHNPHSFQVLTKRPERMRDYLLDPKRRWKVAQAISGRFEEGDSWFDQIAYGQGPLTSPGIWLGTSVEDQRAADERVPLLLDTPAAVRFLSCEPLLGPVSLAQWLDPIQDLFTCQRCGEEFASGEADSAGRHPYCGGQGDPSGFTDPEQALHWVIAGGESGRLARPMHADWARTLRDQCAAADVPFHFKQWGRFDAQGAASTSGRGWPDRHLDGTLHDAFPVRPA
ncbi:DUF5131 family protein [Deinococcus soli (ex Cha et al. 2016)]|uniref:DUF5131 family protein n=1 Tax=Deinococcus soli (ex Cha et al. 2016) TaxID=1309411 RepID=UPI001668F49A|nr:phage Gp37/Gp68 family protein [Deinococcus soli (ex Cha et al. 2016)]GGB68779.1 hypothetical protein GCM10008019_26240 [Deinococcus soli (ex Cha et al. 2016)]